MLSSVKNIFQTFSQWFDILCLFCAMVSIIFPHFCKPNLSCGVAKERSLAYKKVSMPLFQHTFQDSEILVSINSHPCSFLPFCIHTMCNFIVNFFYICFLSKKYWYVCTILSFFHFTFLLEFYNFYLIFTILYVWLSVRKVSQLPSFFKSLNHFKTNQIKSKMKKTFSWNRCVYFLFSWYLDGMAEILCEAGTLAHTVETMARYGHCEGK